MRYTPDRWVVLKIVSEEYGTIEKVLAGWYGGYADTDRWQMNSGIIEKVEFEDRWEFHGYSGSVYICYKGSYGLTSLTGSIFDTLVEKSKDIATVEIVKGYIRHE